MLHERLKKYSPVMLCYQAIAAYQALIAGGWMSCIFWRQISLRSYDTDVTLRQTFALGTRADDGRDDTNAKRSKSQSSAFFTRPLDFDKRNASTYLLFIH